ncbi:hypothetical protein QWZ13_11670 [Reinekea marina]|uniref:hypothetical protein n=1 Tax=Reinekea marina TaxID=1310421 RepID=UPI0025B578F9|nr:hypothetical protein [Reinekea marina]MDN3649558.1 hypothetical protein [Reinekea marina]MDN3649574.1 hypothetical protein [Reinekea marina]
MLYHDANKISGLEHIDLWESFVLGWELKGEELRIKIDAYLFPEHEGYTEPKENEWACFASAYLIFDGVKDMDGFSSLAECKPAVDATGEKDFGHIEDFQFTVLGEYIFTIEFAGKLNFKAQGVRLSLENV